METHKILHMIPGDGEFSYVHNSSTIPGKLFSHQIKPLVENAITYQMISNIDRQYEVLKVADLGCGMGPTPVAFVATVIDSAYEVCKESKKGVYDRVLKAVQIYMNDLLSNDFNMLFKDILKLQESSEHNDMPSCFVMGTTGSFYGRLFPTKSLHFVLSNCALHWLSKVPQGVRNEEGMPMNKGTIGATKMSSTDAVESYYAQYVHDFTSFLSCRSQEVVTNGQMVLAFPGRPSIDPGQQVLFDLFFQALSTLVSKGVITEEKLDSFDVPWYFACREEIEGIVSKQGSFVIDNMEFIVDDVAGEIEDNQLRAETVVKFLRSVMEAIMSCHFGSDIWNELYPVFCQVILKHLNSSEVQLDICLFVVLLTKK